MTSDFDNQQNQEQLQLKDADALETELGLLHHFLQPDTSGTMVFTNRSTPQNASPPPPPSKEEGLEMARNAANNILDLIASGKYDNTIALMSGPGSAVFSALDEEGLPVSPKTVIERINP